MYIPTPPRRNRPTRDECKIDIKKTKSGVKMRFSPACKREHLEYAKEEAKKLNEGEEKSLEGFD